MDLARYARVLSRFRWLVAGGLALAVLLTVASVATIGPHGLKWRHGLRYRSQATVFITQPGFPWGRANDTYLPGNQRRNQPSTPVGDPQRMASLTGLYAQLAMTDPVRARLTGPGHRNVSLNVRAVAAPAYSTPAVLPLLRFTATAGSPSEAEALANTATVAFQSWLTRRQADAKIQDNQRVIAEVVSSASTARAVTKHSKSLPVAIFLAVVAATLGLALALENLRPEGSTLTELAGGARDGKGRDRNDAEVDATARAITLAFAEERRS